MMGSVASRRTIGFARLNERSVSKASSVPRTVVPAAVAIARNKVFHATPHRVTPFTQPNPHTRSLSTRSAAAMMLN